MLKSIFKALEEPDLPTYFQQKFIEENEPIPKGWTDKLEDIPKPNWTERNE